MGSRNRQLGLSSLGLGLGLGFGCSIGGGVLISPGSKGELE